MSTGALGRWHGGQGGSASIVKAVPTGYANRHTPAAGGIRQGRTNAAGRVRFFVCPPVDYPSSV